MQQISTASNQIIIIIVILVVIIIYSHWCGGDLAWVNAGVFLSIPEAFPTSAVINCRYYALIIASPGTPAGYLHPPIPPTHPPTPAQLLIMTKALACPEAIVVREYLWVAALDIAPTHKHLKARAISGTIRTGGGGFVDGRIGWLVDGLTGESCCEGGGGGGREG